jgi:hypothetical protein
MIQDRINQEANHIAILENTTQDVNVIDVSINLNIEDIRLDQHFIKPIDIMNKFMIS